MKYPKKIMKTMELVKECGFDYRFLLQIAHTPGQKCAYRLGGGRMIFWDTEKLQKYIEKHCVR